MQLRQRHCSDAKKRDFWQNGQPSPKPPRLRRPLLFVRSKASRANEAIESASPRSSERNGIARLDMASTPPNAPDATMALSVTAEAAWWNGSALAGGAANLADAFAKGLGRRLRNLRA